MIELLASSSRKYLQSSLLIALIASIGIHCTMLLLKKNVTPADVQHLKAPIAIVIVNSQSRIAPVNPKKLAQHNLNGGGEQESPVSALANAPRLTGIHEKLHNLQAEQNHLLSVLSDVGTANQQTTSRKSEAEQDTTNQLEAELAKRIELQSQSPRKAVFTSTSAKSVVYAEYYHQLRRKVEAYGTNYFPRNKGVPLYGSLILLISVKKDGVLLDKPRIEKSSGNAELDRQTLAIVQASSPFEKFSPAMRAQFDVIDWVATFEFVQGVNRSPVELRIEH
jgi:protein TonB